MLPKQKFRPILFVNLVEMSEVQTCINVDYDATGLRAVALVRVLAELFWAVRDYYCHSHCHDISKQ